MNFIKGLDARCLQTENIAVGFFSFHFLAFLAAVHLFTVIVFLANYAAICDLLLDIYKL